MAGPVSLALLAHDGSPDESVAMLMLTAGLWVGWAGSSRIRATGFPRMPVAAGWTLLGVGVLIAASSLVLPRRLFPPGRPAAVAAGPRPASTATIAIASPSPGQVIVGDELRVRIRLEGGRVIEAASTRLTPDTGHIHIALDGALVSMTYGELQLLDIGDLASGSHELDAEFVAADHGPFDPRVVASVTFEKGAA